MDFTCHFFRGPKDTPLCHHRSSFIGIPSPIFTPPPIKQQFYLYIPIRTSTLKIQHPLTLPHSLAFTFLRCPTWGFRYSPYFLLKYIPLIGTWLLYKVSAFPPQNIYVLSLMRNIKSSWLFRKVYSILLFCKGEGGGKDKKTPFHKNMIP